MYRAKYVFPLFLFFLLTIISPVATSAPLFSVTISNWSVHPWAVLADGYTTFVITASVTSSTGQVTSVTADLTGLGRSAQTPLYDDGQHNDGVAGDGRFGLVTTVSPSALRGEYPLYLRAIDTAENETTEYLGTFTVLRPLRVSQPDGLPSFFAWGTEDLDWQETSGIPWNYNSRFLTWEWQTWNENFVRNYVTSAWSQGYVPILSVYMLLHDGIDCEGLSDQDCSFQLLQDPTTVQGYFDRLQEAAHQASGSQPVIFILETDLSAYMQSYSIQHAGENGIVQDDPTTIPARSLAFQYPDTFAGAIQRMVDLIHQTAPNALVALQARLWATGLDIGASSLQELDLEPIAQRTALFLGAAGGPDMDLISVDWKTNDAGSGLSPWWDDNNQTLPHFNRVVCWENALAEYSGKSLLLWRVPAGNMNLPNQCDQYQDNRVDYAFSHVRDLADAGVIGLVIRGGLDCQTGPSTDGGNIAAKGATYYAPPAMPTGLVITTQGPVAIAQWAPNDEFDLWGYRIYYGRAPDDLSRVWNAGRHTRVSVIPGAEGLWYFALAAYDAMGNESPLTTPLSGTVEEAFHVFLPITICD